MPAHRAFLSLMARWRCALLRSKNAPHAGIYKIYLLRSSSLESSARWSSTYPALICTCEPLLSDASNETVSSNLSMTVCNRRAPMFSVFSLTWKRDFGQPSERRCQRKFDSCTSSVFTQRGIVLRGERCVRLGENAHEIFCRQRASIRREWETVPAISGIRSEGLETWNAPEAINRM